MKVTMPVWKLVDYIPREASRRTFLRQGYAQVLWREALGHESPQ